MLDVALHHFQGIGIAEKSVDTLNCMILKVPKATIAEACYKLNNMIRPGFSATPISCFFRRQTHGHLPNLFDKECKLIENIQKRIANQFAVAGRRGHLNHDVFKVKDRGRVQDPATRRWNILGMVSNEITADDGSSRSYKITMGSGQELIRNGSNVRHSEIEAAVPEQSS